MEVKGEEKRGALTGIKEEIKFPLNTINTVIRYRSKRLLFSVEKERKGKRSCSFEEEVANVRRKWQSMETVFKKTSVLDNETDDLEIRVKMIRCIDLLPPPVVEFSGGVAPFSLWKFADASLPTGNKRIRGRGARWNLENEAWRSVRETFRQTTIALRRDERKTNIRRWKWANVTCFEGEIILFFFLFLQLSLREFQLGKVNSDLTIFEVEKKEGKKKEKKSKKVFSNGGISIFFLIRRKTIVEW